MPLRLQPFPFLGRLPVQRSLFHSSAFLRESPHPNHYETLEIPVNASPAEVKKSFYNLSKTHHPDRNPTDPSSSSRFQKISEAYSILSAPEKRSKYDREHIHPSQSHHAHYSAHPHQKGSYHSSGPVGGRPASGLSRRRTQFRGPPPSFYRSGGWGEQSAKRKAAQDTEGLGMGTGTTDMGGGMGTGQAPFGHMGEVPHFDREAHYRTQENHSKRWQRRREHDIPSDAVEPSALGNFLVVGGVLTLAIIIPGLTLEMTKGKSTGKESRRINE